MISKPTPPTHPLSRALSLQDFFKFQELKLERPHLLLNVVPTGWHRPLLRCCQLMHCCKRTLWHICDTLSVAQGWLQPLMKMLGLHGQAPDHAVLNSYFRSWEMQPLEPSLGNGQVDGSDQQSGVGKTRHCLYLVLCVNQVSAWLCRKASLRIPTQWSIIWGASIFRLMLLPTH